MKRNWDTIREILLRFEDLPPDSGPLGLSDFQEEKAYEYSYHVELLIEAGLVYGRMEKTMGRHAHDFWAQRLTWEGHEFLDSIKSDTIWNKTKTSFLKGGLSMTLDLVKEVAKELASASLKAAIGS